MAFRDSQQHTHARDALAAFLKSENPGGDVVQLRNRLARYEQEYGPARPFDAEAAAAGELPPERASEGSRSADGDGAGASAEDASSQNRGPLTVPEGAEEPRTASEAGEPSAKSAPVGAIILMGGGGALLAAGAVTGVMALNTRAELTETCPDDVCDPTDPTREELGERGSTLALVTDIALGAGLVSAAVGTVLLIANGREEREAAAEGRPVASFGCGPQGCAATLSGRF